MPLLSDLKNVCVVEYFTYTLFLIDSEVNLTYFTTSLLFFFRDGLFAFDFNERTADKIVEFMKE